MTAAGKCFPAAVDPPGDGAVLPKLCCAGCPGGGSNTGGGANTCSTDKCNMHVAVGHSPLSSPGEATPTVCSCPHCSQTAQA